MRSSFSPAGLVLLLFLVLVTTLVLRQDLRPPAVGDSVPVTEFSSGRAMRHLQQIARAPHPVGSEEHDRVRDYLLAELAELGVETDLQSALIWYQRGQRAAGARIENVLARLRGSGDGRAILLCAHYDSTLFGGPGASDDGVAVAALLETLRALIAGEPLANDVIVLLSDGEELGLLGAAAFVEYHPWAADVAVALNFEARGCSGESVMFQTSAGNRRLIDALISAAPYPVASSLSSEVYRHLPNDTDFSVFRRAGYAGYDFAYFDGVPVYHTLLDDLDHVDKRSLLHHGSYALTLTRHLGNLQLDQHAGESQTDAIYFATLGTALISYPQDWAVPLALLLVLCSMTVIAVGHHRGRLQLLGVAKGLLICLSCPVAAAAVVWVLRRAVYLLHPGYREMLQGELYNGKLYALGFSLLSVAVVTAILDLGRRWTSGSGELALGGALLWLAAALATAVWVPGASYLFTWPLLFSLSGIGAWFLCTEDDGERRWWPLFLPAILAVPVIVLLTPTVEILFQSLTLSMAPIVVVVPALGLVLLALPLDLVRIGRWRPLSLLALTTGLALLIAGSLTAGFDRDHPRPNSLVYSLDAGQGKASWITADRQLDAWTSQVFAGQQSEPAGRGFNRKTQAPVIPLTAPQLEVTGDELLDGVRHLRLRLASPRGAAILQLRLTSPSASILAATLPGELPQGQRLEIGASSYRLMYIDPPPEGFELTLELGSQEQIEAELEDLSDGLPEIPQQPLSPRTPVMMPKPYGYSDVTIVRRDLEL